MKTLSRWRHARRLPNRFLAIAMLGRLLVFESQAQDKPAGATGLGEANPPVMFLQRSARELRVSLLDENSLPAPGVTVHLYGLERGEAWPLGEDATPEERAQRDKDPWWVFVSDGSGVFRVHFPMELGRREEHLPGQGIFYLVAELPDGRKAVSPRILHGIDREDTASYSTNEWDEKGKGAWVFPRERHDMTLQLRSGRTIAGVVTTSEGKALPGVVVSTTHDLHVGSHTGYGGDIFHLQATTDATGHFRLEHVYPVPCRLEASKEEGAVWTRTRLTLTTPKSTSARWLNHPLEMVPALPENTLMELTLLTAPHAPTYRYTGRVIDATGHPMGGLQIVAGVSSHPDAKDYADNHHFEYAQTDAQGQWVLEASAPYVRFFDVRTNGKPLQSLGGADFEGDDAGLAEPGEYDYQVKAPAAAEKGK